MGRRLNAAPVRAVSARPRRRRTKVLLKLFQKLAGFGAEPQGLKRRSRKIMQCRGPHGAKRIGQGTDGSPLSRISAPNTAALLAFTGGCVLAVRWERLQRFALVRCPRCFSLTAYAVRVTGALPYYPQPLKEGKYVLRTYCENFYAPSASTASLPRPKAANRLRRRMRTAPRLVISSILIWV